MPTLTHFLCEPSGIRNRPAEGEVSQRSLAYVGQSLMPVLCPSRPTVPYWKQTDQKLGSASNSLKTKTISCFQGLVWGRGGLSFQTLDLAILVRVQASQPKF
jgi:hypothetical protein